MKIFTTSEKIAAKKIAFGKRIRDFRNGTKLSQIDFSELIGLGRNYLSELETGSASPSIEMLIMFGAFFGVEFYQLANPDFPAPTFEKLPSATRKAIDALRKKQQRDKEKSDQQKAADKEEGKPGRARQLHALLEAGFFKRPKTAKDAFVKLNPGIPKDRLADYLTEIGKITTTLTQGRFLKLLDKLEPAPGTTAVRFVIKDPAAVPYTNEARSTQDLAADAD